jgi:3',5'-cyclic AMP phosphodiesterase CpdA
MTDIHLQPEKSAVEGFEKAIARTNTINPDFVLTGGDLIMDALGQKESRADSLYDLYQESVKNFKMPVYNTLGNHEVFGLYVESGIDPQHPEYGKAMYKKRLKEESSYYSFNHKGWHFMVLDGIGYTEDRHYYGKIDSLQIRWIKEDLKNISKDTPIIISTHIPFYSLLAQAEGGPTKSLSEGAVITNGNKILELFEDYNLKLVLQGHLHIVEDLYYKGTHFITAGAVSGSWWNGPRYGFEEGFVVVEVRAGDFDWHYEDYGWEVAQKD